MLPPSHGTPVGGSYRRSVPDVPVRHGAYWCEVRTGQRPLWRSVTSKPVQRWRCTYTIALSVTVSAVIASVGPTRWTWAFRGPGCAGYVQRLQRHCRHSKENLENRRVRRPYLFKRRRRRHRLPLHLHHRLSPNRPFLPRLSISSVITYCVTCVSGVREACRRVCVSSTFYQTGEIKREKKYTHRYTRPLRHTAIVTAVAVTILHYCVFTQCTRNHLLCFRIPTSSFSRCISIIHVARDRTRPVSTENVGIINT